MSHQTVADAAPKVGPARRKPLVWLAGGFVVVAGAGIALVATVVVDNTGIGPRLIFRRPPGDPGGVRQQALRSISVALPKDAKVQLHSEDGPGWDSCFGRPGTEGWSDVNNGYQFTSTRPHNAVIAEAQANMKRAGWTQTEILSKPVPAVRWTKNVPDVGEAKVMLSLGSRGPNTPSYWDLSASAPSGGPRVSGC